MGKLHVVSDRDRLFRDRKEAGQLLAEQLKELKGKNALVLGIPRGGIIVAREIASKLDAELDIALSRKIGSPADPEVAVGAVAENGELFLDRRSALFTAADDDYIKKEKKRQLEEISRRGGLFRKARPKVCPEGRIVILADDGIATGATAQAALWALRSEKPDKIIAAIPVGDRTALQALAGDADEVICLQSPRSFGAVGAYYSAFGQVSDEEVLKVLKQYCEDRGAATSRIQH